MNKIESAIQHIVDEAGVQQMGTSLRAEFDILQKAHDAIHEFKLLAPLCFPAEATHEVSWQSKSAFLVYHWEVFHHAHRSFIEALGTYYNAAFILLRTSLELLLKGAFWECLSHRQFRDNSPILDASSEGKAIKNFLWMSIEASPNIENELDQISAGIFDRFGHKIEDPGFRPSIKTLVRQLDQWGIFDSIPDPISVVYNGLYSGLSADVHVIPDKIDIGRRIDSERSELFEQLIDQPLLQEYATTLHEIMDVGIVIELNILQNLIERFESVQPKLAGRHAAIEQLGLQCGLARVRELLK